MTTRDDIIAERAELKARFGALYTELEALLFELDPIEINFGTNTDEYDPEVRPILAHVGECSSRDAVLRLVHVTFVSLFDAETAGSIERYAPVADWLWERRERWVGR